MMLFRLFLVVCLLVLLGYTAVTISIDGLNLLPVFVSDVAEMRWPGQFNTDFLTFLLLSGLWVSWRHGFSASGLGLGLVAVFGGMIFLSAYLLFHSYRTNGNMAALLLGPQRAAG